MPAYRAPATDRAKPANAVPVPMSLISSVRAVARRTPSIASVACVYGAGSTALGIGGGWRGDPMRPATFLFNGPDRPVWRDAETDEQLEKWLYTDRVASAAFGGLVGAVAACWFPIGLFQCLRTLESAVAPRKSS